MNARCSHIVETIVRNEFALLAAFLLMFSLTPGTSKAANIYVSAGNDPVVNGQELAAAIINQASENDIIILDSKYEYDVSAFVSKEGIRIEKNITIQSDRGEKLANDVTSQGARIYVDRKTPGLIEIVTNQEKTLFQISASKVIFEGLRLEGPAPDIDRRNYIRSSNSYKRTRFYGIRATGENSWIEVRNNELSGWSYGAISVAGVAGRATVVSNFIHHNRLYGNGYGVMIEGTGENDNGAIRYCYAEISGNTFDHNRHDITGTGDKYQYYHADGNLILSHGTDSSFDMHGEWERYDDPELNDDRRYGPYAGNKVTITNNVFLNKAQVAVGIRGRPLEISTVANNYFAHSSEDKAVLQTDNPRRVWVSPKNLVVKDNITDFSPWYVSFGGEHDWEYRSTSKIPLKKLAFGDFGTSSTDSAPDGVTDVFYANGNDWKVSHSATANWEVICSNCRKKTSRLKFGQFGTASDSDATKTTTTDVFYADGNKWKVSFGGRSSWARLMKASYRNHQLLIGNFNGGYRTEILLTTDGNWYFPFGDDASWNPTNTSGHTANQFAVGEFGTDQSNNMPDDKLDVIYFTGSQWKVSYGGTSNWHTINTSSGTTVDNVLLGEFGTSPTDRRPDGLTDVLYPDGSFWNVSFGARSNWHDIKRSGYTKDNLRTGDFNGDGITDVFGILHN